MAFTLAEQEARRDHLSAATGGSAIFVALDYTVAADVTAVHHVTVGHVDSVWVQAWNSHTEDVDLNLVLNPSDDTSTTAIDLVTVTTTIPAKSAIWVLQGDGFRLRGSNTATIMAYTATDDINRISLTGYVVRSRGALIY